VFRVLIPVRAVAPEGPASAEPGARTEQRPASAQTSPTSLAGVRVLVVDDEPDARDLVEAVLSSAGADVATAASVPAALAAVQTFRPHVVVSDIAMPDEDGYSLIRRLHASAPDAPAIPSVALTAYTRNEDRTKALAAGFTTHVAKPVNPDDLVATVLNLAAFARRR
jgi:CheY-like chemotaxis protein